MNPNLLLLLIKG